MDTKTKISTQLKPYLPEGFSEMIASLVLEVPVKFKIVRPRSSKLGDFRAGRKGYAHQITINGDLNPYAFLVTTLHEFAHLKAYEKYGSIIQPHGEEWKQCFRSLLLPAIDSKLLPIDITNQLVRSLTNTKASSCSDLPLLRVLKSYDLKKDDVIFLENLPKNTTFVLGGKLYIKGELRRKRFICKHLANNKEYLIHTLAEVHPHIE